MGQIIGSAAKPKRCNLQSLSSFGTPAAGEYILVSSDNSMNAAGQGNFDCYIVGNGTTAATSLPLYRLNNDVFTKEHTGVISSAIKSMEIYHSDDSDCYVNVFGYSGSEYQLIIRRVSDNTLLFNWTSSTPDEYIEFETTDNKGSIFVHVDWANISTKTIASSAQNLISSKVFHPVPQPVFPSLVFDSIYVKNFVSTVGRLAVDALKALVRKVLVENIDTSVRFGFSAFINYADDDYLINLINLSTNVTTSFLGTKADVITLSYEGGKVTFWMDWDAIDHNIYGSNNANSYNRIALENYVPIEKNDKNFDKEYVFLSDLTENGYYDSTGTFNANNNLRSLKIACPDWAKSIVYSNTHDYIETFQAIRFYSNSEVLGSSPISVGIHSVIVPNNCTHISFSYLTSLGDGTFSAYISPLVLDDGNGYVDTEASLRDALWALDNKNPFVWKSFDRANVTFMQDGCKDDVNSFRLACEKYGVPFTTTFQTARLNASITFSDVDGNAKYFGRELIAGQEYVIPIVSGDSFTKLRVYADCRCSLLGQQVSISIRYYTSASAYTTASENVTLSAGKTYVDLASMSNVIKVGIIVSCGNALTLPLVNFCLTPYDETANNTTKTGAEIGKLIHQNYGEVMQHGDWLFNTLDKDLAYNEFIKQSYVYKKGMEDAIGVKIQGIIGLGGPNSDRWQHTEMGQKFMLRQYLYSNWFGTTPQYSIPRSGAEVLTGQVFTFTSSASLSVNSQYLIDVGSNQKDTIIILSKNGTSYIAAKRTNNNAFNVEASGSLYNVGSSTSIGTFTNGALADDATTGYWYVEQNKGYIASAISNNSWLIIWCHSEIKAACFEYMAAYISGLESYGTGIKFATFADMYDEYKSSTLLGA